MNKLFCEKGCNKTFDATKIIIGSENLKEGIKHHYLQCPKCGCKYTSYYTDDKIRELQTQVKALQKQAPLNIKQRNQLNRLIRRMQFMNNQLKMKVEQNEYKAHKESP